jgi:hypothetical protein
LNPLPTGRFKLPDAPIGFQDIKDIPKPELGINLKRIQLIAFIHMAILTRNYGNIGRSPRATH